MPVIVALTDTKIRNTKPSEKPVKLTDGGGLYLEVRPTGTKLWRYRYRIAGKENVYAIGKYPQIKLAEAREERDHARRLVQQGIHPAHRRRTDRLRQVTENANTFETVAREWMDQRRLKWTPHYFHQVERFLEADVFPHIGSLAMRSITAAHLLEIVRRIEARGAETVALLVRQWASAIFRYAVATLRADADPAAALKGAIHRPKINHRKPLSRADIPRFLKALESYSGYRTTVIALRLGLLTFVRTVELRAAEWSEVDSERKEWRIPAERMKMREPHIVPLSKQCLELLYELRTLTGRECWLFPNYRRPKTCMSATTLNQAIKRMGFGGSFSAHGFRATASTILNEMGFRPDVIERQLAHKERNKVRASYNQAQYLAERRQMMQAWADTIESLEKGDNVVPARFGTAV